MRKVSAQERRKNGENDRKLSAYIQRAPAVFLLMDIRHDPSANDKMMYEMDSGSMVMNRSLLRRSWKNETKPGARKAIKGDQQKG